MEHLSQALSLGVSEDDLPTLYFRLGLTYYRQGRHPGQALTWVKQGLDLGAENPAAGYDFLVYVYLHLPQPNPRLAGRQPQAPGVRGRPQRRGDGQGPPARGPEHPRPPGQPGRGAAGTGVRRARR